MEILNSYLIRQSFKRTDVVNRILSFSQRGLLEITLVHSFSARVYPLLDITICNSVLKVSTDSLYNIITKINSPFNLKFKKIPFFPEIQYFQLLKFTH